MTLYSQADSNIRKTWLFLTGFFIFIILVGWLFSYLLGDSSILFIAVIISVIASFGSYWYSDKIALSMMKANPIEEKDQQELYRAVENLCITAGLPMPKIFIIEEQQPNAFATGRDQKHAVVAITRGLLSKLDKPELEGVMAHELSHIGNKDMLISTIVVIMAGIIAMVSNLFLRIGFSRRRDSKNTGGILMVLGIAAAILAPIAASLVQLAISRKREFLADAEGALLTRYPDGLIRALEKISQDQTPMKVNQAASTLFISSPFKGKEKDSWFTKLFMTHPPIEDRIKALRDLKI